MPLSFRRERSGTEESGTEWSTVSVCGGIREAVICQRFKGRGLGRATDLFAGRSLDSALLRSG